MRKIKSKKSILAIICIFSIILIGGTFAYFTTTDTFENIFTTSEYGTIITETFTSPTGWLPGDTTPKTITAKNDGNDTVRVRIKLEESWTSHNNNPLPLFYDGQKAAIINFDNEEDWIYEFDDGYYYYAKELQPGETTSSLIQSVTFNPIVEADVNCTTIGGTSSCVSTGDGYDKAVYKLKITVETTQADYVMRAWSLSDDPMDPQYIVQITTSGGVTTKYETVESAVAALQNGDLLETLRKIKYDQLIDIVNKEVTISGAIEFTSNDAGIQISGKTLTLQNLTITGISDFPVMASGTNKSRNTRIYVGENSNVSITGSSHALGNNYGKIEIHSGTYTGNAVIYCGGSQSGGYYETVVSGSGTHLYGTDHIFSAFSNSVLTADADVNIHLSSSTGKTIKYQGGNAVFTIPSSYTINNVTGGSCTINAVYLNPGSCVQ